MSIEIIRHSLPDLVSPVAIPDSSDPLKAAAVLIILHEIENHLSSHAGQISFPGGRFETVDQHLLDTAFRETEEEIGLPREHLDVISQLDEHPTLTGYRIFPYIAFATDLPKLVIDKAEVDEIFNVPLPYLVNSDNQQLETALYKNKYYDYYKINWQNKIIWGATARMIVELSGHLQDRDGVRVKVT